MHKAEKQNCEYLVGGRIHFASHRMYVGHSGGGEAPWTCSGATWVMHRPVTIRLSLMQLYSRVHLGPSD